MALHPILRAILDHKRDEIAVAKQTFDTSYLRERAASRGERRSLVGALKQERGYASVIAEIKRASPRRILCPTGFDPVAIARSYEQGGAAAISCLTDTRFFCGAPHFVPLVRAATSLPVLRKEFILDPVQLLETAALGADAVLLMAVCCESDGQLADLYHLALELGLEPLMEIHSEEEWRRIERLKPTLVGVNNRDFLSPDLAVDLSVSYGLAPLLPDAVTVVSESGITSAADIKNLSEVVDGFLIGSALMSHPSPGVPLSSLLGSGE